MNKDKIKHLIEKEFCFKLNKNEQLILTRFIFEIIKKDKSSLEKVINYLKRKTSLNGYPPNAKFAALERALIKKRFPLTSKKEQIKIKDIFLNKVRPVIKDNYRIKAKFKPSKIFVETQVKNSKLLMNFKKKFPKVKVKEISSYPEYTKNNKFNLSQLKKPFVFIIKEQWDFLKPCPCTKEHLNCGYWVLNLGFGCPFDCSYCFLQQYTNSQGVILPANLEDFFIEFDKLNKKLKKPLRIGTGEFCDSLALDYITGYSKQLIPYFKDKKVLFELKTKSASITNLINIKPAPNIVISWSLNPASIIKSQELGTATLAMRIKAAKKLQNLGYKIAFHFDPIIYSKNWEKLYLSVIDKIYSNFNPGFVWISLGTLRCNRGLKTIHEMRHPASNIFYGELFLGNDKKLRYPKFLRKEIYQKMIAWIKKYDKITPLYLCMEDNQVWQELKLKLPF